MKNAACFVLLLLISIIFGCNSSTKPVAENQVKEHVNDTVRIANEEMEYEVIIIDGGFNYWLNATAKPRGFYPQSYLEARNVPWVTEWNNRSRSPKNNYERDLFLMQIDYQNGTDYGYEVNYLLYNYLVYFQMKNNIRLGGFVARP